MCTKDQRIYVEDPKPHVSPRDGRLCSRLQAQSSDQRVNEWTKTLEPLGWQRVVLRHSTQGRLEDKVVHRRVWLWGRNGKQAHHWHLIVRREIDSEQMLKFILSNAEADLSTHSWPRCKPSDSGASEPFKRPRAIVVWLSTRLEERILQKDSYPLLSCSDIEALLKSMLLRRDLDREEVIRQMEKRQHKRLVAIQAKYRKQGLPIPETIGAVNLTK